MVDTGMCETTIDTVVSKCRVDFKAAERYAKRLLRACSKREQQDVVLLFHALRQVEYALTDQSMFDPTLPVTIRQIHVNRIAKNIAYVRLIATARPKAFAQFAAVQEELDVIFKLT